MCVRGWRLGWTSSPAIYKTAGQTVIDWLTGSSCMGSPDGIRTRATALRGRRARPLHNGALSGLNLIRSLGPVQSLGY